MWSAAGMGGCRRMVWCPGIDGAFDQFVVLDHDGDILSLGRLDGADDLPPLRERIEVRLSSTMLV